MDVIVYLPTDDGMYRGVMKKLSIEELLEGLD
jgi:hypothetical protein